MKDNTGLSIGYRMGWRLEYIGVSVFGPAQHVPASDPKRRLRRERARRVIAAGRPSCPLCSMPLDATGHVCPRQNGYRR